MNSDYPRLLIVNGTPIGHASGTSITLSNLFSGWPQENMLQLCYSDVDIDKGERFSYTLFPAQTAYIDNAFRRLSAKLGVSRNTSRQPGASVVTIGKPVADIKQTRGFLLQLSNPYRNPL